MSTSLARLGSAAEDYQRIGIKPDQVLPWEDGARTDGSAGTYEWWYFDAHLDDGAKLVVVDVSLTGEVPAWRPGTGHMYFGPKDESEFDWLPSVPQGKVDATYNVAGQAHSASGVGYHDHNWGNAAINAVINHWYWARGQAGPYTAIASYITAEERFGSAELPIFMLARDGKVVADDATRVRFEELGTYTDADTGKPVANLTRYTYTEGDDAYSVTFTRYRDLAVTKFIDDLHGPKKVAAKLIGFDGAYLRFTGELRIEHRRADTVVDSYTDSAIWELMYLGKTRTQ